ADDARRTARAPAGVRRAVDGSKAVTRRDSGLGIRDSCDAVAEVVVVWCGGGRLVRRRADAAVTALEGTGARAGRTESHDWTAGCRDDRCERDADRCTGPTARRA